MATAGEWIEGARLRTLPLSASSVVLGTALAVRAGAFDPVLAALCLVVGLAVQVGTNFANDYSDGVRGTDADRVGPQRLVGSGAAPPQAVKTAAFAAFGVSCLAGLVIVVLVQQWWLLAVGAACVAAAWFYTGGPHPYGYAGWGEVFVFVFFGLVATCGTAYVQKGALTWVDAVAGAAMGFGACAVLVVNNLRDIPTDEVSGKRTLAVRLGDGRTRLLFGLCCYASFLAVLLVAFALTKWALIGAAMGVPLYLARSIVAGGGTGMDLVRALKLVSVSQLVGAIGVLAGSSVAVA
jgi:1,4-dihydroxy-2-naphthoate octaprenyltransferase